LKRSIALIVACALLGACSYSGSDVTKVAETAAPADALPAPTTDAQAKLRQQADTSTKTVLEGAAVGAAVGALAPVALNAAGAKLGNAAPAIGAAAGAAIGGLAGAYVDQKQKEYASLEDQLDSVIQDARAKNQQARDLTATMRTVLDEHKRQLSKLRAGIRRGTATQEQLDAELASARADKQVMDKAVNGTRDNLKIFTDTRDAMKAKASTAKDRAKVTALDSEIRALSGRINTMSGIVDNLSRRI